MWLVIIAGIICLFVAGGGVFLFSGKSLHQQNQLLEDLGLSRSRTKSNATPYYKWGWRKAFDERVWGERIVRLAFEKAKIWLSPDDLLFFKNTCDLYATGKPVKDEEILAHIDKIVTRKGNLSNCATKQVKSIITGLLAISDKDAMQILKGLGVRNSDGNARRKLGMVQFRRMLNTVGSQILAHNAKGYEIKENEETLFTLQGFDGWKHWVAACKEEVKKLPLLHAKSTDDKTLLLFLQKNITSGVIKEMEDDLRQSQQFLSLLEEEIYRKEIRIPFPKIERLESIFYYWQFTNGIPFHYLDHGRIRELLTLKNISSRFKEIIINAINPNYPSFTALTKLFPDRVIFYGDNAYARAYASQQYIAHYELLLQTLNASKKKMIRPPALLLITASDIERARTGKIEIEKPDDSSEEENEGENQIAEKDCISQIINEQKKISLLERNIDGNTAETIGWIIDMAIADFTVQEYAYLDSGPNRSFIRIPCSGYRDVDFQSFSEHAKKQKWDFFNFILDSIVTVPALGVLLHESVKTDSTSDENGMK
ncbi:MAG: hypothetical protein C4527_13765 [Candidatus Omnitrophota bacterium]|nr:MAG: hypothetical protein C4527_13765 [Candidatus Omnitrophota bacterium]